MNLLDLFLFIGLPYIALATFLIGSIYRYRQKGFQVSSLSSEFLERKNLFWGSQPFHIGLLFLFFGHLLAFLIPDTVLLWNNHPVRLLILEIAAFVFGIAVLFGLVQLIIRRVSHPRLKQVTNNMDLVIEFLLLAQTVTGLWIAFSFRWGSSWFASVLTPYLWSLFSLSPDISAVSAMPWAVKLHIVGAYLIIFIFPFSRLIHFLVAPIHYLWRPYQVVYWNYNRRKIHNPNSPWGPTKPKNN